MQQLKGGDALSNEIGHAIISGIVDSGTNTTITDAQLGLVTNVLATLLIVIYSRANRDTGTAPYTFVSIISSNTSDVITFGALPGTYAPTQGNRYIVKAMG